MRKKVVFCSCNAQWFGADRKEAISTFLNQRELPSVILSDLCGCAVNRKEETKKVFDSDDEFLIIACYPRAVNLLLEKCGVDYTSANFIYLNIRELTNNQLFNKIDQFFEKEMPKGELISIQSIAEWPAWFPIIDYSRCTACGQCADFCLFGVYEKKDHRVVVVNPEGCKNNCPACGRICPQTAIVFPKYDQGGAISGSDTIDEISEQQRQQHDIDTILGSNIYQSLERRKLKRQSIIRSEFMRKAMEERDQAKKESNQTGE